MLNALQRNTKTLPILTAHFNNVDVLSQNRGAFYHFPPSNVNDCDDFTAPNTVISAVIFYSVFLASIWQNQS